MTEKFYRKSYLHIFLIILLAVSCAQQSAPPNQYQISAVFPGLEGQQLLDSLVANYKPATVLSYDQARDTIYAIIDNHSDSLSGVYTGFTIYIDPAADPSTDAFNKGINAEHSWPQSKGAVGNAKSDMHHLFPCKDNVNSSRSNNPYDDIADSQTDTWYRKAASQSSIPGTLIDEWAEKDNDNPRFEPREIHKGNAARAMFYFYAMYKAEADAADPAFFDLQKDVLRRWNAQDAPDAAETARNNAVAAYQDGKVNPFILDTTLVQRAWFAGTGSGVQNPSSFSATVNGATQLDLGWTQNGSNDDVMIVWNTSGSFGTPVDGTTYTQGQSALNGTIIARQSGTVYSHIGLNNGTRYYYKAFSVNGSAGGESYSSGVTTSEVAGGQYVPQAGDIIISEIMQNPNAVLDSNGEWFELYNTTANSIDLNGWTIKDLDTDSHVISGSLLMPGHGFLVLGIDSNSGTNGGVSVDYRYSGVTLANGADELLLLDENLTEIDRVEYDGGVSWPDPTGASMVFTGAPGDDNNNPANWTTATQTWSGSSGDKGSPGGNGSDQSLPVTLLSFTGRYNAGTVTLHWETASEYNSLGFVLQRRKEAETVFQQIGSYETDGRLRAQGGSAQGHRYQFSDAAVQPDRSYKYRLIEVSGDGAQTIMNSITVRTTHSPGEPGDGPNGLHGFILKQNFPNPFNPETRIGFSIDAETALSGPVLLEIFDIAGRRVRTLLSGYLNAGDHLLDWNGRDGAGRLLPGGTYFYRLLADGVNLTRKMLLVR